MGFKTLATFVESAVDLLCPDRCTACGDLIERPPGLPLDEPSGWCTTCAAGVVPLGRPFCLDCRPGETRWRCSRPQHLTLLAGVQYGVAVRELVHATKYQRLPGLVSVWLRAWVSLLAEPRSGHDSLLTQKPDLLVPIPLHPSRVRERGADVVQLWCNALSRFHAIPTARVLRRRRATPPQVGLGREQRRKNLADAFATGPDSALAQGKSVAIVDDVVTTGATGREAAAVLFSTGAQQVSLWSFAYEPLE